MLINTHRFKMQPTERQLQIVRQQIGREPRGIEAIAAQTPSGVPLVLQMRSLIDDKPFPTLYWLSSKDLSVEISRVEMTGWIKRFEEELQEDAELRDTYMAQQKHYMERRWELMRPEDRQRIETLGFTKMFNEVGIGGIANWDKVRCLHMNYAYHLVEPNVVGQRLDQEFQMNELAPEF
ncbi:MULTISPECIES: DUF501 domain-containing protein [unclassified Marinobacterium]|uniref:DUF501 domain-containing protein n=2 Tax=Marinobacterium TaxID=48075 RepID=UPI0020C24114|nr:MULTISPECIES: DUF501 domain-containing protein [unclassified Marinobacterium]